jgi:glutamate synthase (ferredoxin)
MELKNAPLWRAEFEHDSCGTGFVANRDGSRSHKVVTDALVVLKRLAHRGGAGYDPDSGDGAGILIQLPDRLFRSALPFKLPEPGAYGAGMFFFPRDSRSRKSCVTLIEKEVSAGGFELLGWRDVPHNLHSCGTAAREAAPWIMQAFVASRKPQADLEQSLYILRRSIEKRSAAEKAGLYVVSFSSRTVVYKGMMHAWQLEAFYPDLADERTESAMGMIHSRYSTNTLPTWSRSQPCRMIAHNGEINTLRGAENSIKAMEHGLHGGKLKKRLKNILPILEDDGSDSMKFDNAFEFYCQCGRPMPQSLMLMMPGPWSMDRMMDAEQRAFYKYAACLLPPWDGPAAITFTDGRRVGAVLDRNGLRPARWALSSGGVMVLASESGVLDIPPEETARKGKLGPGQMILLDLETGELMEDAELKEKHCAGPYRKWLRDFCVPESELSGGQELPGEAEDTETLQHIFGYTHEDVAAMMIPMAQTGNDPVGAMGYDAPLAVLSEKPQPLYNYFKQLFAQVTNPPLDAIREACVTGMDVLLGPSGDITQDTAENCRKIHLKSPVLSESTFRALRGGVSGFKSAELPMLFTRGQGLMPALEALCEAAEKIAQDGVSILILTDRGASQADIPMPALLASSCVHHHLIRRGLRGSFSIVVDSFEPREVHHICCLIGYGVKAVFPRGALKTLENMADRGLLGSMEPEKAKENYLHALEHGVLKVISKMGISCVDGYIRAQIFEAVGLAREVIDRCFTGTVSRMGGVTFADLERETLARHDGAVKSIGDALPPGGRYSVRRGEEEHLYNPQAIHLLQTAVREGNYKLYKEYSKLIGVEKPVALRHLLDFKRAKPVPLDEVEPVERIMRRFKTGAMSYGSISLEAHECLARAMNGIRAKSNSGEGGEAPERFGTDRNSAIKQVASGRFGVTGPYLASAKEIQIKMAQGAKPGEGGQLPGNKVYPHIARVRHSTPGVGLISPPPHHDIYSIEDLAQLIFDLKNANPDAAINVKLVSETGVGTVAAGVAKGGANVILISGFDGGTGASPRTSMQHAGLPWEIGLAESHQVLTANGLRGRVRLEVDGKLMTGRDVAVAALLGAEEYGFATLPLVACGCIMMRVCNVDNCPMGIATQNPALRARFRGKPEYVVNLMKFVAEELREIMAEMGFRTVEEMVGLADRLEQAKPSAKAGSLDLRPLLETRLPLPWRDIPENREENNRLFYDVVRSLAEAGGVKLKRPIQNTERAVATRVGAFVSREYGSLPDGSIRFVFEGTAGQSFGAFIPAGMELTLVGEANDYLGKGLSGGRIVVRAPESAAWPHEDNLLCGNVVLYGATSGELFLAGRAGERFCVRNSGATAVCEGVGDHGCEYMTGGAAVILGPVGRNFAAGMSGGTAYVLDDGAFRERLNDEMVGLYPLDGLDVVTVYTLVMRHAQYTNSAIAREILEDWPNMAKKIVKVLPHDYSDMLACIAAAKDEGLTGEARMERAFALKTAGRAR